MGMIAVKGGICAAEGFMAAATAAKIKSKRRDDMAMIFSEKPCVVAGTFTSNVVKAAPVLWDRELVDSGRPVHAAVINSGIANACTGQMGLSICKEEADATAEAFGQVISADSVLLASTGIIGLQLPIEKMKNAISEMVPKLEASEAAARTRIHDRREEGPPRRYDEGLRHDPSADVHDDLLPDDRSLDHEGAAAEGPQRERRRYLQHDLRRWRYLDE